MAQTVVCIACGHVGQPKTKGSFAITIILLFIGLLPGIIYEIWRRSGGKVCSACGSHSVRLYVPAQRVVQQTERIQQDEPTEIHDKTKLVAEDAFSYRSNILSDDEIRKQELRRKNQAFINRSKKSRFNFAKLLFVTLALALGLVFGLAMSNRDTNYSNTTTQATVADKKVQNNVNLEEAQKQQRQTEREQRNRLVAIQTDSRIALKNYLKDPDSAEIRNHNGNCGEVNSKNSFGGYSGFKRFIASPAIVAIEGENMDSDEFQKAWDQVCK